MNKLQSKPAANLLIQNAHIVDPANQLDEVLDLQIKDQKIMKWGKGLKADSAEVINAKGLHLFPGLIDLHVHFREPGFEHKETIESGVQAAISGGFVACVTMPNTKPACDNAQIVKFQIERGNTCGFNIFPAGALSQNREGGKIAEMAEMCAAGAVAVSDDGQWLKDSGVARRAYEYAATYCLIVMTHPEDPGLSRNGVMNESISSTKMGLRGIPNAAEDVAVARDIELARLTGCRLHIQHVSTHGAVEMIRQAKKEGLAITAEATPHHLALTDMALYTYDTNFKVNPPLRIEADRLAVIQGLKDGTIDAIATDHAPHAVEEKDQDFEVAPSGVIGLESAFGVVMTELYHSKHLSLNEIIRKMSFNPSEILGKKNIGRLGVGETASLILVDLQKEWVFDASQVRSRSKNSCFFGKKLKGKVLHTLVNGTHYSL